jgi:hypothetical protein
MAVLDPGLISSVDARGGPPVRLGVSLLDEYLEFVAGRCRPNTVLATASASAFNSPPANESCLNPGPSVAPNGTQNPSSTPEPGDASPVPLVNIEYPADDVGYFFGPGVNGTLILLSHHADAAARDGQGGIVFKVRIVSTNGELPFSANDFSVETTDGRWYAGVPARILDPTAQESLSNGVVPANRMIDGLVAFDTADNLTAMQFIDVGLPCNISVTWQLGT